MVSSSVRRVLAVAPLALVVLTIGCGGGNGSASDDVATLSDDAAGEEASTDTTVAGDLEEQYLEWQECMAGQGLDVPDLTVDADGNPQIAPPAGGGGGGGGGGGDDEGDGPGFDPEAMEAASEVCGEAPEGVFGGGGGFADNQEFQDAALEFAQCMRDNGVDVPDPDFSDIGGGDGEGGGGGGGGGGGPFGGALDQDDPAVQTAMEACESILGDLGPGGPGGPGAATTDAG